MTIAVTEVPTIGRKSRSEKLGGYSKSWGVYSRSASRYRLIYLVNIIYRVAAEKFAHGFAFTLGKLLVPINFVDVRRGEYLLGRRVNCGFPPHRHRPVRLDCVGDPCVLMWRRRAASPSLRWGPRPPHPPRSVAAITSSTVTLQKDFRREVQYLPAHAKVSLKLRLRFHCWSRYAHQGRRGGRISYRLKRGRLMPLCYRGALRKHGGNHLAAADALDRLQAGDVEDRCARAKEGLEFRLRLVSSRGAAMSWSAATSRASAFLRLESRLSVIEVVGHARRWVSLPCGSGRPCRPVRRARRRRRGRPSAAGRCAGPRASGRPDRRRQRRDKRRFYG